MSIEQREELRLALVMNGGVSLAVWMGGVSNEIFRLITQQHPVYSQLLDMTRSTARVDVISGTSAGGVNGAAMTLALLYGGDLANLRNVWLKVGSINDLMRPPMGNNSGSLLMGDEYFLPKIHEAFQILAKSQAPRFTPCQMDRPAAHHHAAHRPARPHGGRPRHPGPRRGLPGLLPLQAHAGVQRLRRPQPCDFEPGARRPLDRVVPVRLRAFAG